MIRTSTPLQPNSARPRARAGARGRGEQDEAGASVPLTDGALGSAPSQRGTVPFCSPETAAATPYQAVTFRMADDPPVPASFR